MIECRKHVVYKCRRLMTHQDFIYVFVLLHKRDDTCKGYSVVTLHPGRKRIYPLGFSVNNVPGSLFLLQSCHDYDSTRVRPFFFVVSTLFLHLSFTFLSDSKIKPLKKSKNLSMSESDSTNKMSSIDKFKTIHEYHFDCLKNMFCLHYKTWCITRKYRNEYWTLHLSNSVIHKLRVHLSWVVIKDPTVFHLTRIQIGMQILKTFKQKKILRKMLKIVRKNENIMNIYMEISC